MHSFVASRFLRFRSLAPPARRLVVAVLVHLQSAGIEFVSRRYGVLGVDSLVGLMLAF